MEAILILHNIRSAQNVGSLFRTSDALGIKKIYLSNITPNPVDRFGRDRKDISKTALGAEKTIKYEQYVDLLVLIEKLKIEGYKIIAIEQNKKSIDYKKIKKENKIAFILGNEVEGLDFNILENVNEIAEIKMLGEKESLNVSVAGGIVMFRILDI